MTDTNKKPTASVLTGLPATKTIITVTRKQLWESYIKQWGDLVYEDPDNAGNSVIDVANVLCRGPLDYRIRKLFRDGHTCFLMGDFMQFIDLTGPARSTTLLEIVIVDGNNKYIVDHSDINF